MKPTTSYPRPLEIWMRVRDPELLKRIMASKSELGPRGMSGRHLARALGWKSHTYVNRILSGEETNVSAETGTKIAFLLGVPTDLLFVTKASTDAPQSVSRAAS